MATTLRNPFENSRLSPGSGDGNGPLELSVLTNVTLEDRILPTIRPIIRKRRTTHRKLRPIQVFMITVNATLGTGLYWRGGQILELGGPLAVIVSFLALGILSWGVMQCITELLCIWPVPGALSVFVRVFVDPELGIAVGIAYWFTYSVSFAALIAATAGEVHYWTGTTIPGLDGGVLYLLVPLILIVINCFGIEMYGSFEVATGITKLLFFAIIAITMIVFAVRGPRDPNENNNSWHDTGSYDEQAAQNWGTALFMCLSTATFAYVGVEVPAAAALEARPTRPQRTASGQAQRRNKASSIGKTIRFSSQWVSVFACAAYTLSGILVSLSVERDDCQLPLIDWLSYDRCQNQASQTNQNITVSVFTFVAESRGNGAIADAFNVFLVLTALSCANTNLYVASRTLFGLTNQIDSGPGEAWYLNVLAWFGRTNNHRVPIRAMTLSAVAFIWVPFLQLYRPSTEAGSGTTVGVDTFINILSQMGSVGVLIVWACECWAYIRYYHCIEQHQDELSNQRVQHVRRFSDDDDNDYPYISNGQPVTAYLGLAASLLILLVLNGASLWMGFYVEPFLSSYLIIIIFVGVWVGLKLCRRAKWALVDLSNPEQAIKIFRYLHGFSFAGFQDESKSEPDRGTAS
ncbi:amino acid permease-domain-containing protein [Hypoxylon rubiginosum]|uniref:Amino acid permease-domain-containing protein n=1 Tax=Hypoxylon rubiginosum TaxID=110542 RepID=A0ACB9Z1B0_9PEZI|nr:amino acid permease-domain-containing protein [Hypoxylon rubiginosum]